MFPVVAERPRRLAARVAFLCAIAVCPVLAQPKAAPSVLWFNSYDEGIAAAKSEGKPVLIDFVAEWCVWCKKMDEDVYSNREIAQGLAEFVCIRVDVEKDPRVALAYDAGTLPRTLFLNIHGEVTIDQSGFLPLEVFQDVLAEARAGARTKLNANAAPAVKPIETPAQTFERTLHEAAAQGKDGLLELLSHPEPAVRAEAERRIAAGGDSAIPALVRGLSDTYLGTRIASLRMLETLGVKPAPFDPWAPRETRATAAAEWERWLASRPAKTAEAEAPPAESNSPATSP
ncbi:MAG: thioredoxin family protein [Candidatus Hydrogenedentes bacterium]|nr:thioredoxin family protein [Candidatus Hydrogenedentota bacterium]